MCKTGLGQTTMGVKCGEVIAKYQTQSACGWACRWVTTLNRADFAPSNASSHGLSGGDSGAPVFWNNGFYGLAGPNDQGYYSRANNVQSDLVIEFCLTNTC